MSRTVNESVCRHAAVSSTAAALITPTMQPGQVFLPMHYEATNRLTLAHFDPYSHQPSYKDCAVRVERREATR